MKIKALSFFIAVILVFSCMMSFGSVAEVAQRGDCNGDGVIDAKDVLLLRRYATRLISENLIDLTQADCNDDGYVNNKDLLLLRKYLANVENIAATTANISGQWNNLLNWEDKSLGETPSEVSSFVTYQTSETCIKDVAGKNTKVPSSTKAVSIQSCKPQSNTANFNPTQCADPTDIALNSAKMETATGLRACIKVDNTQKREAVVAYIGFYYGRNCYYKKLTLENYSDFAYFYFAGKTYDQVPTTFSSYEHELNYKNDAVEPLTLTSDMVKNIKYIGVWFESESEYRLGYYYIDDIDYYVGNGGYDSSAEDAALPQPVTDDGTGKYISLTFDDGPVGNTGGLVDVAEEYGAHYSFFVIGKNLDDSDVEPLKRAVKAGCEIQNHTWDHVKLNTSTMTADKINEQVNKVDTWLNANVGVTTTMLRPPMLEVSSLMYNTLDRVCIGGVTTMDYEGLSVDYLFEWYKLHSTAGNIVLIHEVRVQSIELTRRLTEYYTSIGYKLVNATELFNAYGVNNPVHNKMYTNVMN